MHATKGTTTPASHDFRRCKKRVEPHLPSEVWLVVNQVMQRIQVWLGKEKGVQIRLKLSWEQQVKLLRLWTWAMQTLLTLEEVLEIVLPPLRVQRLDKRRSTGLQIDVKSVVSRGARRILDEEIAKHFEPGVLEQRYRDEEQRRQLEAEMREDLNGLAPKEKATSLLAYETLEAFVRDYTTEMDRKRMALVTAQTGWRKRKKYRGNPWL